MRFDQVPVGTRFFHSVGDNLPGAVFEKKSKSSAYTVRPVTMNRGVVTGWGSVVVFGHSVQVYPLYPTGEQL